MTCGSPSTVPPPDRPRKQTPHNNANGIRFSDSPATWNRQRLGGEYELKGPYLYGSPLRHEVVLKTYRETVDNAKGLHPSNGYFIGLAPEVTWNRYHWHDLVPSGYRVSAEFRPGYFLGTNQNRHEARLRYLQGGPLASATVLMINGAAEALTGAIPTTASSSAVLPEASHPGTVQISFRVGEQLLNDLEDRIIAEVLQRSNGNKTLAAKHLGITRWMLDRRRKP